MSRESVQTAGGDLKYIASMLGQLCQMAKQHDAELAYFIAMAGLHATELCDRQSSAGSEEPYLSADLVRAAAI